MADEDRNRRRLQRVQQLKAQDSTMTSSKALDIMRREEADAERAAKVTEAAERARQREAEEERRAAKEQEKASKETGKAERERGKAAKEDITKDKEDINKDKQEENFLKKLTNKNSDDGSQSSTSTDSGAYAWVSVALIFIGLAEYLLRISTAGLSSFAFGLSLLLFLLSGLAIAHFAQKDKLAILIPMILFVVWYFFFNGNYAPGFLLSFLPIAFVILLIPIFFTKGQSTAPELLGFVPVLFFFLDIGLIPFLVENLRLPVTPLLQSLVLFMPWWALLGIFTLPGTVSKSTSVNLFLNALRIIGILYIVIILIAPAIPGLGLEKSLLPGKGEFEAAQQRLRAGIPQQENPAWSNLVCIFSEPTGVQTCVEQRQEISELTYLCEKVEGKEKGTPQFTQCLEEQKKKKQSAASQVQGVIDPTIKEPTKAEITINKESFPTTYNAQFPFPFELKIENPRKLQLGLDVTCNFEGKFGTSSVEGRVEGAPTVDLIFNDAEFKSSYLCLPKENEELKGKYKVWFNVTLKNMITTSRLQRAFVGDKTAEEIDKLRREEISRVIKTPLSLAPADFAHINFDLGHAAKEIVIESKDYKKIVVKGNIENTGSGKIVAVKRYEINLESEGFSVQQNNAGGNTCLQGEFVSIPSTSYTKTIPLPTCLVTDYPQELKTTNYWVPKTFTATLLYDYRITKDADIDIKPAEEVVGQ